MIVRLGGSVGQELADPELHMKDSRAIERIYQRARKWQLQMWGRASRRPFFKNGY